MADESSAILHAKLVWLSPSFFYIHDHASTNGTDPSRSTNNLEELVPVHPVDITLGVGDKRSQLGIHTQWKCQVIWGIWFSSGF